MSCNPILDMGKPYCLALVKGKYILVLLNILEVKKGRK